MRKQLAFLIGAALALDTGIFIAALVSWNEEAAVLLASLAVIAVSCELFDFSPLRQQPCVAVDRADPGVRHV